MSIKEIFNQLIKKYKINIVFNFILLENKIEYFKLEAYNKTKKIRKELIKTKSYNLKVVLLI